MGRQPQRLLVNTSHQARAKRKSTKEWGKWHGTLVHLYQEEFLSRKEIVEVMRRDHDFIVSKSDIETHLPEDLTLPRDKQLKYHFQKGGVTKRVSDNDLSIMLALKRQNEAVGRDVIFNYKNHDIHPSRIERALKKRKAPLPSPSEIPSYIKIIPCPLNIFPTANMNPHETNYPDLLKDSNGVPLTNVLCDTVRDRASGVNKTDSSGVEWGLQEPGTDDLELDATMEAGPNIVDRATSEVSWLTRMRPYSNAAQSIRLTPSLDGFELTQPFEDLRSTGSTGQNLREPSVCTMELDWSAFLNDSPRLPAFAIFEPRPEPSEKTGLQACAPESQDTPWNGLSPIIAERQDHGSREEVTLPPEPPTSPSHGKFIFSKDIDAEAIICPLQSMKSHLQMVSDHSKLQWYLSNGSTLPDLYTLLQSRWLTVELDNLLHWSYEASVKSSLRRRTLRTKGGFDFNLRDPMKEVVDEAEAIETCEQLNQGDVMPIDTRLKFTSYWLSLVPMGALSIRLKTETRDSPTKRNQESPWILSITSMPKQNNRTTGISARFVSPVGGCDRPSIPPHITTFNLVPEGSPIIQHVSRGDLQSVKRIFGTGEASPRDVDPWGFSLLSYAMYTGCSEVFCFLLECGVGLQNCERFGNALDAIWAMWSYFVVFNSYDHNNKESGRSLRIFEACVAMTDKVLKHGCDIQDTLGYSAKANALFEICYYWPMEQTHPSIPAKALRYLIDIGYELEQPNEEGQTPLLWTAGAYQPQVIKCLRVFIERKANVDATDADGRGALHCALLVPHVLDGWQSLRLISQNLHVSQFYYLPSHIYHTQDAAHNEDYSQEALRANQWDNRGSPIENQALMPQIHGPVESHQPSDLLQTSVTTGNGPTSDETGSSAQPATGYVMCRDFEGNEHRIRDPVKVLKTRLAFKLLTLLSAGCDPNVLDNKRLSPSDYARRDGLWPQWFWALENTGYVYEVRDDRWIKQRDQI